MSLLLDPEVGVAVAGDAVERAAAAGASAAKATHCFSERFEVNFETGALSLIRTTVDDSLSLTVFSGDRKGSADMTGRDHDGVRGAVVRALEAAEASEPDPANVLPTEAAEPAFSGGDHEADRDEMVGTVVRFVEELTANRPDILTRSSHYSFVNSWRSYANSHGRTQHSRRSSYVFSITIAGRRDGKSTSFQYCTVVSAQAMTDLSALGPIVQALNETEESFGAKPIPATFVGDVIITPHALESMVAPVVNALSGMALMKKTTPYLDRLGEAIASPAFSLRHRPSALAAGSAFDGEGFASRDLDIVTNGVLQNYLVDWYMSHKLDRPMTTGETDLEIAAGETALADMVASTERGIIMGRYSGGTPNQKLDFSGIAKNSFYVEHGRIVGPVSETMVAGNLTNLFQDIKAVSSEQLDYGTTRMPWLSAAGVTVSTK